MCSTNKVVQPSYALGLQVIQTKIFFVTSESTYTHPAAPGLSELNLLVAALNARII